MLAVADAEGVTLIERAYNEILSMIGDGRLKQSEIISHRTLAESLKISKQPIGIALQKLEYEGVVESKPRVGTLVRQVTAEDMWGMLQWRIGLEMRTAALACDAIDSDSLARLHSLAASLDASIEGFEGDFELLRKADMEFHLLLAECSGCQRLRQELAKLNIYYLKSVLCEAVRITRDSMANVKIPVSHIQIANAIKGGDQDACARLLKAHIEKSSDMRKFTEWYESKQKRQGVRK